MYKRQHQGRPECVAVGKIFGASPLFRVPLGAVEKPPGCHVERSERLQQKFECDGGVDSGVFGDREGRPCVLLDDVEHADFFFQGPASKLITDGQAVFIARVQVRVQRSDVLGVKIIDASHVAVSYTHLDVYKRQTLGSGGGP